MSRSFPAKLLLFGEYTVLSGSQALAVPLTCWQGNWVNNNLQPKWDLVPFMEWMLDKKLISQTIFLQMHSDTEAGWKFDSQIPVGHGVGSSGAIVAAIYDRYLQQINTLDQSCSVILAEMESYFHGSSSGMDPLVSFENKAVLKDDAGKFHTVKDPGWPEGYNVYLWDSELDRITSEWVEVYKNKIKDVDFARSINRSLTPMVDHAIYFYLNGSAAMLAECIQVISLFQRSHFEEMIPVSVRPVWDEVSKTKGCHMKLCGAGGGGFYLIISTQGEVIDLPHLKQING